MIVNEKMYQLGSVRSAIRELFEYGKMRAREVGPENVYDFSIGNPSIPAPGCVNETLIELLTKQDSVKLHGYTSAQGDFETRKAVSDYLNRSYGTCFNPDNFYMTCGAAASLAISFKAITKSPEDEIICIAPFFPEYTVFISSAGAVPVTVPADTENFQIDMISLEKSINIHTRAVVINTPNNPSGTVYSEETLKALSLLLERKSEEFGSPIFLISDEPYREIVYDCEVPYVTKYYRNTIVCYSYSKSLSLPGERIGWILVPDEVSDSKTVYSACLGAGRALGYVCAPSIFQKMLVKCVGQTGDINAYRENRDILYDGLTSIGYRCHRPSGAFYMFVKALTDDTDDFCMKARDLDLLVVSAEGFHCPGWVRISYCVDRDMIRRSMPAFKKLYDLYRG